MASIDTSIVLIALPAIFNGIHINPLAPGETNYFLWLLLGYMVVTATLLVTFGRISDMFGRVRLYNLGFLIFACGSILLWLTPGTGTTGALELIVFRLIQAVGSGFLFANSAAILTDAFPANQRGLAMGVNQIAAISNEGTVRFMTYSGALTAAVFLTFLSKLVALASRKVLLIVDGLQAHKTPEVEAWVEAHREQIEVFYLPAYSPELNPVEYLNNDMKGTVNEAGLPPDQPTLRGRLLNFMKRLVRVPEHVISYFLHPWTQYAAPAELV